MKKRLLSLTLIAALCLSLFPVGTAPAQAATSLAIGDTVTFAGHDWYIIGTDEEADGGVTAPEGCYTLFAKNNDFGTTTFRAGADR